MVRWTITTLGLASTLACSEPPAPPAPVDPPGPETPTPPALSALDAPDEGHARGAFPQWDRTRSRFDFEVTTMAARHASIDGVTQILLGPSADEGAMLTFYGEELSHGQHPVAPATDASRATLAGGAGPAFIVTVGQAGGALRSTAGTITLDRVDDAHLVGSADVELRSRNMLRTTTFRARFHTSHGDYLRAQLEHQRAISEQLRRR